jgi:hypothetical protein
MASSIPGCHSTQSQGGLAADSVHTPQSWFNPCAFDTPQNPLLGTAGRNVVIGPGLNNLDFSLLKDIPFRHEGRRLQLRFEFFNVLNIPHFDIPGGAFALTSNSETVQGFGMVQSASKYGNKPPRQIQLGLKYVF